MIDPNHTMAAALMKPEFTKPTESQQWTPKGLSPMNSAWRALCVGVVVSLAAPCFSQSTTSGDNRYDQAEGTYNYFTTQSDGNDAEQGYRSALTLYRDGQNLRYFERLGSNGTLRIRVNKDGETTFRIGGQEIAKGNTQQTSQGLILRRKDGSNIITLDRTADGRIILPRNSTVTVQLPPRMRAVIGINMTDVPEALAAQLALEPGSGVLVTQVTEGHPAADAGLQQYDIITAVDGNAPATRDSFREAMKNKAKGDVVRLQVLRGGRSMNMEVAIQEEPVRDQAFWQYENLFNDPVTIQRWLGSQQLGNPTVKRWSDALETAKQGQQSTTPAPGQSGSSTKSLEQRLEKMERLLERLIQEMGDK